MRPSRNPVVSLVSDTDPANKDKPVPLDENGKPKGPDYSPIIKAFEAMKAEGKTTQVLASLRTAIEDLQGQRLAVRVLVRVQVAEHLAATSLFRQERATGGDEQLRAWAERKLPILEHHLRMARELEAGKPVS